MEFVSFENRDIQFSNSAFIIDCVSGKKWRLLRKLSSGSFGIVYLGKEETTGLEVAIKLESANCRTLLQESRVYHSLQGVFGIPKIYYVNTSNDLPQHTMVMELLGPNLKELFDFCHRKFTLRTVLLLSLQMLQRLRDLHQRGFIHRDVKPENFLIGIGGQSQCVYLIDFGLSKRYSTSRNQHIPYREGRRLTGTAHFVSVNTHLGIEPSRRDDLESLCYCLLYFLKSELPWHNFMTGNRRQKCERIAEKKLSLSVAKLCADVPAEFGLLLSYCRDLDFEETPNYELFANHLIALLHHHHHPSPPPAVEGTAVYDWEINQRDRVCQYVSESSSSTSSVHLATMFVSNQPNPSVAVRLELPRHNDASSATKTTL